MHDNRGVNFAQIERDHVQRFYPPFEWHPFDTFSPYLPLAVPLSEARVAFVTTAGVHHSDQPPFATDADDGDCSWRAFPSDTPLAQLALSHGGYDTHRASADPNVVLPLDHLRALVAEGRIGSLAQEIYSFMGYITDTERLLREEGPAVAARLQADGVDLVLLAPT
jgi:D-proline reductase (dithiol) PrdB